MERVELFTLMEGWKGYHPVNQRGFSEARLQGALDLYRNKADKPLHRWEYEIKEAIVTSDFPDLFNGILDREMLAQYRIVTPDWASYMRISTLNDFRTNERLKVLGQDQVLPRVPEKGEYLIAPSADGKYTIRLAKYGRQFDISWEAMLNDRLGAFADLPQKFANAAIRTESRLACGLFVSAAGPNPALFGAPINDVDGGAVVNVGTLPLNVLNLLTALGLMSQQVDASGEPISIQGVHLVVPPALEFTARAILTSTTLLPGVISNIPQPTNNILTQLGLQLHVNRDIPIIDVSGNANTTWYLFADPTDAPAVEFARLRGHETPEICMKASNKVTVGGGSISPMEGDFETDDIFYRVRHVCGGTQLDPRNAYAEDGTSQT